MIADLAPARVHGGARAAVRSARIEDAMTDDGAAERLPWSVALRLILGLSIGLWIGIWQLARTVCG